MSPPVSADTSGGEGRRVTVPAPLSGDTAGAGDPASGPDPSHGAATPSGPEASPFPETPIWDDVADDYARIAALPEPDYYELRRLDGSLIEVRRSLDGGDGDD